MNRTMERQAPPPGQCDACGKPGAPESVSHPEGGKKVDRAIPPAAKRRHRKARHVGAG